MGNLKSAFISDWLPKDRRPIYEWAHDHVVLSAPLTKTGPFDLSESRHFIEPFDSLRDDYVREVNVLMPVRGGKTLIADMWAMWIPVVQPGATLWVFQDDAAAKDQAELRTWKLIEKCKVVSDLLSLDRHASRVKEINFPHMPFHLKGPADSNLQSRGWQNVICDEAHLWDAGKLEEARGRLGDYVKMGTDKFLVISQGGKDGEDWSNQYNRGVIHAWHVECQKCGHFQYPTWTGVRSDGSRWGLMFDEHKSDRGFWLPSRAVPTVRFECEKCAHPHIWNNRTKSNWNRTGKYIAESNHEKFTTRKSFTCPALVDYPWDQLCDLYLQAMNERKLGNPIPLIQFFQKRMAQFSSEKTVMENSMKFSRAVYEISTDWPEEDVRLMAVDKQEDHYWVHVRACSGRLMGESRRLYYGKLYSYAEIENKREEFKVLPNRLLIDSGYETRDVYQACWRYGWTPLKGADRDHDFTHTIRGGNGKWASIQKSYSEAKPVDPESGQETQGQKVVKLIIFSANTIADRLDGMISSGIWKEPQNPPDEEMERAYRKQMSSVYKKKKINKFTMEETYERTKPKDDHAYDTSKMITLGMILTGVIPDPYDERRKAA